jgi:hypothetical protein
MVRKMFEEHVTGKISTIIEQKGGARDPDRRLDPDPEYAFQGVKNSCVPELRGFYRFYRFLWVLKGSTGFKGLYGV